MSYTAMLTVYDERNNEVVGTLNTIEIEDGVLTPEGIEGLEDFVSTAISDYEEDVWPQH